MRSEVDDQTNRPAMLNSESTPTNPAAAATATADLPPESRKKSWIIGLACSRMPMPAVTLQNSTIQSSQKARVRIELAADTLAVVTSGFSLTEAGSQPSGTQPSAGTRMFTTPNIITTK
jgi:hypothetical protein